MQIQFWEFTFFFKHDLEFSCMPGANPYLSQPLQTDQRLANE